MAVNKVKLSNGETLIDISGDTVTPETLAEGVTAHDKHGERIVGAMPLDVVRYGVQTLTEAQKAQARENIGAVSTDEIASIVEDEKGNIVDMLIAELQGLPVFGVVDENNIITVTSQLSDGTYTLKYENADGTTTEIGTIVIGNGREDVIVYEVDIASIGYTDNRRWSISSGELSGSTATGLTAINLVPITRPAGKTVTIELSGITWVNDTNTALLPYIGDTYQSQAAMYFKTSLDYSDIGLETTCHEDGRVTITWFGGDYTGFKFNGLGSGANAKITYTIE